MSIAARHLETRRPRKDRDVTWSRRACDGGMQWTLWRRDHRRAWHLRIACGSPCDILKAWHELRDFVDEIDLAAMEQTA